LPGDWTIVASAVAVGAAEIATAAALGQRGRLRRQPATLPPLSTSPDRVSKALPRAAAVGVPCSQQPGRTVSLTAKQFHYACGNMLTEEEPDALHVGLFWFSKRRLGGVGVPAWHREPIERAPVWESIHLAGWPTNRLARPGWRRLLPETGTRVRRLRPRERLLRRPCGPAQWRRPSRRRRIRSRRRCPNAV
jgi:hypothetical protein